MFFYMRRQYTGEAAGLWTGIVFDVMRGGKTIFMDAVVDDFGELVPVSVRVL